MPEMYRLHNLLNKFTTESEHGYNLPKRKEIFKKLIPRSQHSDEETHTSQRQAMTSIISDLETIGLRTPTPPSPPIDRKLHKYENVKLDMSMDLHE